MSSAERRQNGHAPASGIAAVDPYSHDQTAAAVARLTAVIEAQARTIGHYESAMARSREVFERASAAARLGLWECDLATETLQWSGGTYDMFDIARDRPLKRRQCLIRYPAESLKTLNEVRGRAIAERTGFNLDTEIETPTGGRRFIRITATVECAGNRAVRLFGLKQDITEEHDRWQRTRYLAEFDELTGLANRHQFRTKLSVACDTDGEAGGTLMLLDLDGFKSVNDSLGHAIGDECLKEASRRIAAACDAGDVVARLGGDEFAVLVVAEGRASATLLARKIAAAMAPPMRVGWRHFQVGVSIGLVALRGVGSAEALEQADIALYAAKASGRGSFRWFVPVRLRG
ncbi:MAG: GGDEF domain-containing protein [Proteobacteria bacterium]|nr:GGDEF domain-containing protein [Pseudomonadota bacterium]